MARFRLFKRQIVVQLVTVVELELQDLQRQDVTIQDHKSKMINIQGVPQKIGTSFKFTFLRFIFILES